MPRKRSETSGRQNGQFDIAGERPLSIAKGQQSTRVARIHEELRPLPAFSSSNSIILHVPRTRIASASYCRPGEAWGAKQSRSAIYSLVEPLELAFALALMYERILLMVVHEVSAPLHPSNSIPARKELTLHRRLGNRADRSYFALPVVTQNIELVRCEGRYLQRLVGHGDRRNYPRSSTLVARRSRRGNLLRPGWESAEPRIRGLSWCREAVRNLSVGAAFRKPPGLFQVRE
jgi:hypothetical protein